MAWLAYMRYTSLGIFNIGEPRPKFTSEVSTNKSAYESYSRVMMMLHNTVGAFSLLCVCLLFYVVKAHRESGLFMSRCVVCD